MTLNNCNFVLNHSLGTSRKVVSPVAHSKQVKNLVVVLLTLNKLKNLVAILLTLNDLDMAAS